MLGGQGCDFGGAEPGRDEGINPVARILNRLLGSAVAFEKPQIVRYRVGDGVRAVGLPAAPRRILLRLREVHHRNAVGVAEIVGDHQGAVVGRAGC